MQILIITDAYPPETRSSSHLMKEMADGLSCRGHKVFVATSQPAIKNTAVGTNVSAGVCIEADITVIRAKTLPHHNVNFILKGISQLMQPFLFFYYIKKNINKNIDIVWVHSPPLPLTITARLVKKYYHAKYFLNLHDFFPQNAIDLGILKNKFLLSIFSKIENRSYLEADIIVAPSIDHKIFAIKYRSIAPKKIFVLPHWIDTKPYKEIGQTMTFRKKFKLKDKFIFLFGGILGPAQGLEIFIRIAKKLERYKDIVFLFVGEGSQKKKIIKMADNLRLENVIFKSFVSKDEYPWLVKDANVGILSLTSAYRTPALPAKLIGYMAGRLPVLAFMENASAGAKIINNAKCGLVGNPANVLHAVKLAEKIYLEKNKLEIYGKNGQNYAQKNFELNFCLNKMEKLFKIAMR